MNPISLAIRQPVTVTVGVLLLLLAGAISLTRLPIALTPNVESTVITVSTFWEGASPEEVELNIVDKQEERLTSVSNLRLLTSTSAPSAGTIRLEFEPGTDKDAALREVSDKLNEVPFYPENADRPVIDATDAENRDYIAWIVLGSSDPDFDVRQLRDFAVDRIEPALERVPGIAEINVLGGREREVQIRVDPVRMSQFGVTPSQLVASLRDTNQNISAGNRDEGKLDFRLRTIGQYASVEEVTLTVVRNGPEGPVRVGDFAQAVSAYKEATGFVRSRGASVIAINADRELGSNVIQVMKGLRKAIDDLNAPGGALDVKGDQLAAAGESTGRLTLTQVYDQTVYIDDALALVRQNIWIGGVLAVIMLLLFLRSVRSVGVIALAIPISIVGAVVAMVVLGRSVNVVSLAGMAFAVGMVVDNAIVVLENIYRHLEIGKTPFRAAYDGAREVWGAVLASTLTTIVVFIPILLVQEEAGQLFRDLALAICAAVGLSMVISVTVIPSVAARVLRPARRQRPARTLALSGADTPRPTPRRWTHPALVFAAVGLPLSGLGALACILMNREGAIVAVVGVAVAVAAVASITAQLVRHWDDLERGEHGPSAFIGHAIGVLCGSTVVRLLLVGALTLVSVIGTLVLMPPSDYLPRGNRNLVFGLIIPPPGYSLEHQERLASRIESVIAPFWIAGQSRGTPAYAEAVATLPEIPTRSRGTVVPPSIQNYFLVSFDGTLFHGGVSDDPDRVADLLPLFAHATRPEIAPGAIAFPFQVPLFQLGGSTGSALKLQLAGTDLDQIKAAAMPLYMALAGEFGFGAVQPSPANFNLSAPEIQIDPDLRRLSRTSIALADIGVAVRACGDGAIVDEYRMGGEAIDLTVHFEVPGTGLLDLADLPLASPTGEIVPLGSIADIRTVDAPQEIARVGRQRSVSFQITPPDGTSLEDAIEDVQAIIGGMRDTGVLAPSIETSLAGSASKLEAVQKALLGDGSVVGTAGSSLGLALIVVYLVMCVLFQSFLKPLVIMFSVPLATLGGFAALAVVHEWSLRDPYVPIQMLDVVTMLGFVLLIGVVVNNAILIVHQTGNVMAEHPEMTTAIAVAEATRTRVRPIFMSMLTSVGGMLPLVVMPGSGSELYRGMGSVVVGGLVVSTLFTLVLVPLLLSLVLDVEHALKLTRGTAVRADRALDPVLDPT